MYIYIYAHTYIGLSCAPLRKYQLALHCAAGPSLATQLVETKLRLVVDGHLVGEPLAVMGSADYVYTYMHKY